MTLRETINKIRGMVQFFVMVPIAMVCIKLESLVLPAAQATRNPFVNFPRNSMEVVRRPEMLFARMKEYQFSHAQQKRGFATPDRIPLNAEFVSLKRGDGIDTEPLKNQQVSRFALTYKMPGTGKTETVQLFLKFTSQRGTTTFVKALMAAISAHRGEVAFYKNLYPHVDPELTKTPHCYGAFSSVCFGHSCVVLGALGEPWTPTTDAEGLTLHRAKALVMASAKLHAQFWRPAPDCPRTTALNERKGLQFIEFCTFFFQTKDITTCPLFIPRIWYTVDHLFKDSMMSVSHGDCRGGNMMFDDPKNAADDNTAVSNLVMTDWEACIMTPHVWDFGYTLITSLSPDFRRRHQAELFDLHVRTLTELSDEAKKDLSSVSARNLLSDEVDLVPVLVWYFSYLLIHIGGVGASQGNSDTDGNAWRVRMRASTLDGLMCDPSSASCRCTDKSKKETVGWIPASMVSEKADNTDPAYHTFHVKESIMTRLRASYAASSSNFPKLRPEHNGPRTLEQDLKDFIVFNAKQ